MDNYPYLPYKECVELKELGFKELCLFAFDYSFTPIRCSDLRTNEQKFNGVNYNNSPYTSQPTLSQVFKWFRNTHKLFSFILPIYQFNLQNSKNDLYFTFKIENINIDIAPILDTHEQAEYECVKSLISILKRKNLNYD
jgi:hypothetical protein